MNSLPFDNSMIRLCAIELISNGGEREECPGWKRLHSISEEEKIVPFISNWKMEIKNLFARLMDFLFELTIDFADICW